AQVIEHCTKPNTVALTFDDGSYIYMNDIVKALNNATAKGTFFVNGDNYDCIYSSGSIARIKNAYDKGHQIASHTWSHPDLTTLTKVQINNEMSLVEQAIKRITGASPAFMRPPYGAYNNLVLEVAGALENKVVYWDFDSGDSTGSSVAQSKALYDKVIASRPSNILTLNHETKSTTAYDLLPHAIMKLKAAGYQLVTVAECLGLAPYKNVSSPATPDSSWHC
ncbi:MAG: carbohydrate esterase family 4 protein, partial [Linnemannia gamsii]